MKKLYENGVHEIYGYMSLGKVFGRLFSTEDHNYENKLGKSIVFSSEGFKEYHPEHILHMVDKP
jgi:hypothetical protein